MYKYLSDYGENKNMKTSSSKFPCTNYMDPNTQNFYNYYNLPSTQNTDVEQLPFYKVSPQNKIKNEQVLEEDGPIKEEFKTEDKVEKCFINSQPKKSIYHVEEIKPNEHTLHNISPTSPPEKQLLPVLDPQYNMREICKQCILLEDHLSHEEKRCPDCCIKHFLTLEALSEEAIQLDKDQKLDKNLIHLPTKIRNIQKKWYKNPNSNSIECSQDLRKIRKLLMENSFPIVFDTNNKLMSCSASKCMLK
jgi:hypothetical protein